MGEGIVLSPQKYNMSQQHIPVCVFMLVLFGLAIIPWMFSGKEKLPSTRKLADGFYIIYDDENIKGYNKYKITINGTSAEYIVLSNKINSFSSEQLCSLLDVDKYYSVDICITSI